MPWPLELTRPSQIAQEGWREELICFAPRLLGLKQTNKQTKQDKTKQRKVCKVSENDAAAPKRARSCSVRKRAGASTEGRKSNSEAWAYFKQAFRLSLLINLLRNTV